MVYAEEVLSRADFSRETDLKRRLFAQLMAGKAPATREISFDDLIKKSGTGPRGRANEAETSSFRDKVREGAEKRREAARTQAKTKENRLDGTAMNNDRAITPRRP